MLGESLRLIRVFHDKKSTDLAKELGISPAYLSKIENEKSQPNIDLIQKYAEVFSTTKSAILFFSDELDREQSRGPFKISIRNKLFHFLKTLERFSEDEEKNICERE